MDPKKSTELDPKLKEAYERVMGTSFTPAASQTATMPPMPAQPRPTPIPQPTAAPTVAAAVKPVAAIRPGGVANTFVVKKGGAKSGISPILLILAGIIFFAVYTIFWVKFFNISIPGLPI